MLHQECYWSTLLVADEAAVRVAAPLLGHTGGTHDEVAVVTVVMERAQSCEVHARLAEGHEVAHHVLNPCDVLYALNDVVGYLWHRLKKSITIKGADLFTIKGETLFTIKGETLFTIKGADLFTIKGRF